MTSLSETRSVSDDARQIMLASIVKATGLPVAAVEELYMSDSDLDALCDSVLSELPSSTTKMNDAEVGQQTAAGCDRSKA